MADDTNLDTIDLTNELIFYINHTTHPRTNVITALCLVLQPNHTLKETLMSNALIQRSVKLLTTSPLTAEEAQSIREQLDKRKLSQEAINKEEPTIPVERRHILEQAKKKVRNLEAYNTFRKTQTTNDNAHKPRIKKR